ncbi:MAG: radical SAM protein [Desulfobacter sp.]|nr:MAG: radical SAM protein [Desulfobacter sp.]
MTTIETSIKAAFVHSGKAVDVPLAGLVRAAAQFLDVYGHAQFCTPAFTGIIGEGKEKFSNLLSATGYPDNPEGFFREILDAVGSGNGSGLEVNGIAMPSMFLVDILEQVLPGRGYVSIKSTGQLAETANLEIPEADRADLQAVIEKYPVRISRHTIRQMMVSRDVAYQYLPFVEELESVGHTNTWIGQFHDGLLEQMYQNRVIFLLNMSCPVYCRFCFRKHKDARNEANPTPADVNRAVAHVNASPAVKEIVVTGGDPFMNRANMAATIDGLMAVDHVQTLRLATRSVAYYPDLFLKDEGAYLKYLKQKSWELQQHGKRMEVATHFIHPDEVSPESLEIISDLVRSGIAVYIQTPFLSDCNDTGPELVRLFGLLRGAGAELHYIYIPCSPIHGNSVYWKPLSDGIDIALHLRADLSDRAIPRICTATPIGKMDWFSSGWAVERVDGNENFVWIRTPYTPEYFKAFAPLANELSNIRVNGEGTIDIQYMARIGKDEYLIGSRPEKQSAVNPAASDADISRIRQAMAESERLGASIVNTGLDNLDRLHKTRVCIRPEAGENEFEYIRRDRRITDVVVAGKGDVGDHLSDICRIIRRLRDIPHVNALRLRSMAFFTDPGRYTRAVINTLGDMNHLSVARPLRIEIEAWAILSGDVTPEHRALARRLNNRGITVYANAPLLGGVNDSDGAIHDLAYSLRTAGIEFHHLYLAGLPVQDEWNERFPVDSYDVVDIATKVRREGSGREIPRYIIATPLGEVDYGLTSRFVMDGGAVKIKLACFDAAYYKSMDDGFEFDGSVETDDEGCPIVQIKGMIKTNGFPVS